MNITKMKLFATPESVKHIEDWIMMHPREEQMRLWTVMGMTWNLLADAVDIHNDLNRGPKDLSEKPPHRARRD